MPTLLQQHVFSKTNGGLILFLVVIVGLSWAGKLTGDTVEALKWVGGSFFLTRASANLPGIRSTP